MKALLVKLTHGLYAQDVAPDEKEIIDNYITQGFVTFKNNIYKFHSKYRAGIVGLVQNDTAYVNVLGEMMRDLFIDEGDLLNAKEGDIVIAKRLLGKRGTPSAKIIAVVGRAQTYSVAILTKNEENHLSLVDLKTKYPVGAELSSKELSQYQEGDLFQIDNKENAVMQLLGNIKDPKVDEKIVLAQYNKHDEFDEEVLKIARSFKEVDPSKHPNRKDLRDLDFCTIDPVTAKDFDDAICWVEKTSTLYVAIADVSHYVLPFGPIDNEAIYRSFSIYLPHRSIPMLPRELSETLCSLQPHKPRLAYVFEMQLDTKSLEVADSKVYEAIIHSKRRFNYEEIDSFFEGKLTAQNEEEQRVLAMLKKLRPLTDALKRKRLKTGYEFHSSEIEMQLDENLNLVSTSVAVETPSHSLIEDCMLLANKAAASKFSRGVFRVHEEPTQTKLQNLYQELAGIGMNIDIKDSVKETIEAIQAQAKEMGLEHEVDTLIIRSQMQARYAPINLGHFGLGFEAYTHFTSPIRRYSDLIVHRLLKAIEKDDKVEGSYVLRNIETLTQTISEKEREASSIEFEFMTRKFARWADTQLDNNFKAKIVATTPEFKAELQDEIVGAKLEILGNNETLTLFEDIVVRITKVDIISAKIYVEVVEKADV